MLLCPDPITKFSLTDCYQLVYTVQTMCNKANNLVSNVVTLPLVVSAVAVVVS